jgi:hypothetical protein
MHDNGGDVSKLIGDGTLAIFTAAAADAARELNAGRAPAIEQDRDVMVEHLHEPGAHE